MEKIAVKNEKFFKSTWQMIIYFILFGIIIFLFIKVGTTDYSEEVTDHERFAKEYSLVGEDNVFTYVNVVDAHIIAGGKKGIVLFGNPRNEWVGYYADIINTAAKEVGIDTIYYYDFYKDREQNNATYEDTIKLLNQYVVKNDLGRFDIYSPTLLVVADGEVLFFDTETSFIKGDISPIDYWSSFKRGEKLDEIRSVFNTYLES